MAKIELSALVGLVQGHITRNYAMALIDNTKTDELRA